MKTCDICGEEFEDDFFFSGVIETINVTNPEEKFIYGDEKIIYYENVCASCYFD